MYTVFADFHHAGLLQSLILLFERRLGGAVYRPIGTDWFYKGYWKVYDHPATVEQFLGIGGATPDGTPPLNTVEAIDAYPGMPLVYHCRDIDSDQYNKAITYDGFMRSKIDIVIASLPQHIEPFYKLCQEHPNHPKLIYQVGNAWNYDGNAPVKNIMASARMGGLSFGLNTVEYHQEFDTNLFAPANWLRNGMDWRTPGIDLPGPAAVHSYVNCFGIADIFSPDWQLFLAVEQALPDWSFKSYGGQCRDGAKGPASVLAQSMRDARFIWHTKLGGDGYGHIIHNAPAVGKPLVVKSQYYQGKMAEPLLKDGETCIAIDNLSVNEIVNKLTYYSDPERYATMCKAAYANFESVVDFDREQKELTEFLANLI